MSELTTNESYNRYSFDSMSAGRLPTQNVTLPKFQPVRLKALLQSDEEDDDESEEKSCQSEDESDFDEPLLQDDSAEDVLQETVIPETGIDSLSIELTNGVLKTACILSKENREVVTSTPSIQRGISFATDREQCKVSDVKFERHIPDISVSDPNKLETYSFKQEEKTQEYHSDTFTSRSQADTIHNHSTNVALLPPSLSVYKGDYNTKFDANKNPQPVNSNQLHHENTYISDKLNKKKEGSVYSTSAENKILLTRSSELNLSKDDQRYKGSFIEQANKDCEEESYKIPNPLSESTPCTSQTSENLMQPVRYSSQKNVTRYEANEKYTPAKSTCAEFSTLSLNETGKSITTINRLVSETPLKHMKVNVHPSPCTSHKQLFQTPQSKISGDLSKNHVQTPSTILSSWYHNVRHTPMEGKSFIAKDHVQMSKNVIRTSIVEKPDSSRFIVYSVILFYNRTLEINNI